MDKSHVVMVEEAKALWETRTHSPYICDCLMKVFKHEEFVGHICITPLIEAVSNILGGAFHVEARLYNRSRLLMDEYEMNKCDKFRREVIWPELEAVALRLDEKSC